MERTDSSDYPGLRAKALCYAAWLRQTEELTEYSTYASVWSFYEYLGLIRMSASCYSRYFGETLSARPYRRDMRAIVWRI
jgi:hypothetical protein